MIRDSGDRIAADFAAFVSTSLADATSVLAVATHAVLANAGEVAGRTICDLGCGEGHLARRLGEQGGIVLGMDISPALLRRTNRLSVGPNLRFVRDDAQGRASLDDHVFNLVVRTMALMDIPNLASSYNGIGRVHRPGGRFVFSITHPCFQAPAAGGKVDHAGAVLGRRV